MMIAWLLIGMLYGPQGNVVGVKIIGTFQHQQECVEEAQRAVEAAKQAHGKFGFSCAPWEKPVEA